MSSFLRKSASSTGLLLAATELTVNLILYDTGSQRFTLINKIRWQPILNSTQIFQAPPWLDFTVYGAKIYAVTDQKDQPIRTIQFGKETIKRRSTKSNTGTGNHIEHPISVQNLDVLKLNLKMLT